MEENTIEIPLPGDKVAIIDAADAELVRPFSWCLSSQGYVRTGVRRQRWGHEVVRLHRLIMGLVKGDGQTVDHIDGNKLNNRRNNLRVCTHAENCRNQKKSVNNTSGYKGVFLHKKTQKWGARVRYNRVLYYAGYCHDTPEAAAAARDGLAKKLHKEFFRPSSGGT